MARLPTWHRSWDRGALLLRVALGVIMLAHGSQKLFGVFGGAGMAGWTEGVRSLGLEPATLWAWIAALTEVGGGLALLLGVATEIAAFLIAVDLSVAIWKVHWARGFFSADGGIEFPLLVVVVALALILAGPGRYALWDPLRGDGRVADSG